MYIEQVQTQILEMQNIRGVFQIQVLKKINYSKIQILMYFILTPKPKCFNSTFTLKHKFTIDNSKMIVSVVVTVKQQWAVYIHTQYIILLLLGLEYIH